MVNDEQETESLRSSGLADRERVLEVGVRTRNDVHGHELSDATGRSRTSIGRRPGLPGPADMERPRATSICCLGEIRWSQETDRQVVGASA